MPSVHSDQGLSCLLTNFQVLILIFFKMIMDSSKNGRWIIPLKKFGRLRVNRKYYSKIMHILSWVIFRFKQFAVIMHSCLWCQNAAEYNVYAPTISCRKRKQDRSPSCVIYLLDTICRPFVANCQMPVYAEVCKNCI